MSKKNNFAEIAAQSIAAKEEYEQRTIAAKKEYEQQTTDLQNEFRNRISSYNTVVRTTTAKFMSNLPVGRQALADLILPNDATLASYSQYTNTYWFESKNGKQYQLNAALFLNDPIVVAQHTRRHIRSLQNKQRAEEYKAAEKALTEAKTAAARAEKALTESTARMEAAKKKAKKEEARVYAQLHKNQAAKNKLVSTS